LDLFATVLGATAATENFAGLLFAGSFVRRPADRDYGLAALLCTCAGLHATCSLLSVVARDATVAAGAQRVGAVGLVAALAFAVHFTRIFRGAPPSRVRVIAIYGSAAVLALVEIRLLGSAAAATETGHHAATGGPACVVLPIATIAAGAVVLFRAGQAYLAGRRGALAIVLGAAALLAAAMNDVGVALGALGTIYLADAGMAAFVVGIATTPSARYATVTHELEQRTEELRKRTRELRRSYEDLRATQEELVKKEQLAVVGELAAVIAHEVRNPLAIIANAGAGLRKQAISWEDRETLLAILDEETSRLNRLVSDLLRYARPVNVQRSPMQLGDLLDRALAPASRESKRIQVELLREAHEGRIWGDANLLRQVFDNLIDNACQAMGSGGTLTVRIRPSQDEGIDGIAVDIIDTGEGMDTQVRSRALDPFFTTRPSGTGLGLAIVDRIVEAHGGNLRIESHAGEGTTVTVFLPNGSASEPPASKSRAQRSQSDPARLG
jgi:signal transduction histidine kinase